MAPRALLALDTVTNLILHSIIFDSAIAPFLPFNCCADPALQFYRSEVG